MYSVQYVNILDLWHNVQFTGLRAFNYGITAHCRADIMHTQRTVHTYA
jgi:hypothetical protein